MKNFWLKTKTKFALAQESVDSKINPEFGSFMYRVSKFMARFLTWIGIPVTVLVLAAMFINGNAGETTWIISDNIWPAVTVMSVVAGSALIFHFVWFFFSKWQKETK